jgi:hypothetical protein
MVTLLNLQATQRPFANARYTDYLGVSRLAGDASVTYLFSSTKKGGDQNASGRCFKDITPTAIRRRNVVANSK